MKCLIPSCAAMSRHAADEHKRARRSAAAAGGYRAAAIYTRRGRRSTPAARALFLLHSHGCAWSGGGSSASRRASVLCRVWWRIGGRWNAWRARRAGLSSHTLPAIRVRRRWRNCVRSRLRLLWNGGVFSSSWTAGVGDADVMCFAVRIERRRFVVVFGATCLCSSECAEEGLYRLDCLSWTR